MGDEDDKNVCKMRPSLAEANRMVSAASAARPSSFNPITHRPESYRQLEARLPPMYFSQKCLQFRCFDTPAQTHWPAECQARVKLHFAARDHAPIDYDLKTELNRQLQLHYPFCSLVAFSATTDEHLRMGLCTVCGNRGRPRLLRHTPACTQTRNATEALIYCITPQPAERVDDAELKACYWDTVPLTATERLALEAFRRRRAQHSAFLAATPAANVEPDVFTAFGEIQVDPDDENYDPEVDAVVHALAVHDGQITGHGDVSDDKAEDFDYDAQFSDDDGDFATTTVDDVPIVEDEHGADITQWEYDPDNPAVTAVQHPRLLPPVSTLTAAVATAVLDNATVDSDDPFFVYFTEWWARAHPLPTSADDDAPTGDMDYIRLVHSGIVRAWLGVERQLLGTGSEQGLLHLFLTCADDLAGRARGTWTTALDFVPASIAVTISPKGEAQRNLYLRLQNPLFRILTQRYIRAFLVCHAVDLLRRNVTCIHSRDQDSNLDLERFLPPHLGEVATASNLLGISPEGWSRFMMPLVTCVLWFGYGILVPFDRMVQRLQRMLQLKDDPHEALKPVERYQCSESVLTGEKWDLSNVKPPKLLKPIMSNKEFKTACEEALKDPMQDMFALLGLRDPTTNESRFKAPLVNGKFESNSFHRYAKHATAHDAEVRYHGSRNQIGAMIRWIHHAMMTSMYNIPEWPVLKVTVPVALETKAHAVASPASQHKRIRVQSHWVASVVEGPALHRQMLSLWNDDYRKFTEEVAKSVMECAAFQSWSDGRNVTAHEVWAGAAMGLAYGMLLPTLPTHRVELRAVNGAIASEDISLFDKSIMAQCPWWDAAAVVTRQESARPLSEIVTLCAFVGANKDSSNNAKKTWGTQVHALKHDIEFQFGIIRYICEHFAPVTEFLRYYREPLLKELAKYPLTSLAGVFAPTSALRPRAKERKTSGKDSQYELPHETVVLVCIETVQLIREAIKKTNRLCFEVHKDDVSRRHQYLSQVDSGTSDFRHPVNMVILYLLRPRLAQLAEQVLARVENAKKTRVADRWADPELVLVVQRLLRASSV
jgi:hypothetical protein